LFITVENNHGTANDLRPGEKVTVSYQASHGVLIADRIEQRPVRFEGMVAAIDPGKHTLTLHLWMGWPGAGIPPEPVRLAVLFPVRHLVLTVSSLCLARGKLGCRHGAAHFNRG
jgi:hypothetical protein